ncbi:ABC transporter permease [Bacteroides sp. 214]|uniref:ABC transporter permease n=1 Tax=Bacteroides sp. 214 TaxID=2302935 RepID=UPI0013D7DFEB|nr:FtsX-like permease family protein [Bacteroides sp. 214]NDW12422.1 ABC transporter permease [Bacteroides sp. 214]
MLKHIFTSIWNNRKQNLLLIVGLFVISTCLWFAVDYVYAIAVNHNKPLGFDWRNVYSLRMGVLTEESARFISDEAHTTHAGADLLAVVDRLEHHPAVEFTTVTLYHKHYVWMNNSAALALDSLRYRALIRIVTPDYFKVFKVKGAYGETPEEIAEKAIYPELILTQDYADILFPNGNAVGQRVRNEYEKDSVRISAVIKPQKYNEYSNYNRAYYQILNMNEIGQMSSANIPYFGLYIRVKPEMDNSDFIRTFRKEMRDQLMIGNLYLEDMQSVADTRKEHLKDYRNDLYTYLAVAFFFLLNAFLAVLGTFWSRTQHRHAEIGLRLAMGSTKKSIRNMLFNEGLLLLSIAFIPAAIVAYNLGKADVVATWPVEFTLLRFVCGLLITFALLALIMLGSILFPARQAMNIEPAEALSDQ